MHMERGEQNLGRGFPTAHPWKCCPKPFSGRQNPLPRALPTRTRFYHGFQTAPGEGRGVAVMLWLCVTSTHPGWRCYQSPWRFGCKATLLALTQDKCFVSARFKGTARLLEIKLNSFEKKKKIKILWLLDLPESRGSPCPQDAGRDEHVHLETIIADASITLKMRKRLVRGPGAQRNWEKGDDPCAPQKLWP